MDTFHKILFYSRQHGRTAGLILKSSELDGKTISDLSRLFPLTEFRKMQNYYISEAFPSWEAAFDHAPKIPKFCTGCGVLLADTENETCDICHEGDAQ